MAAPYEVLSHIALHEGRKRRGSALPAAARPHKTMNVTDRHYVLANPRIHDQTLSPRAVTACGLTRDQLPLTDTGNAFTTAETTCARCRAYLVDFRFTRRT